MARRIELVRKGSVRLSVAALAVLGLVAGCNIFTPPVPTPQCATDADCAQGQMCNSNGECVAVPAPGPEATFATSLHGNREGKRGFYEGTMEEPGFFAQTNLPYDDLPCKNCHAATYADGTEVDPETYTPGCRDCHADPDNPTADVPEETCLKCHGRIGETRSLAAAGVEHMSDVHTDAGMVCMDCHKDAQVHGDGNTYISVRDPNLPKPSCEECHGANGPGPAPPDSVLEHQMHLVTFPDTLRCEACHVQSVVSCDSCHFETELQEHFKRFYGPPPRHGYVYLLNGDDGRVTVGSSQSLTYDGKAFITIAPFYAHTIAREGRHCDDCHGSEKVAEYFDNGTIRATEFVNGEMVGPTGVIPITEDWKTTLLYDYAEYLPEDLTLTDPPFIAENWQKLEPTEELRQMLFGSPLTAEQMNNMN